MKKIEPTFEIIVTILLLIFVLILGIFLMVIIFNQPGLFVYKEICEEKYEMNYPLDVQKFENETGCEIKRIMNEKLFEIEIICSQSYNNSNTFGINSSFKVTRCKQVPIERNWKTDCIRLENDRCFSPKLDGISFLEENTKCMDREVKECGGEGKISCDDLKCFNYRLNENVYVSVEH